MKEGTLCTYLANPDVYCERISTLIQSGTDEWQSLWQQAIKELFHNSEIFQNPVNNINAINSLLKVIEKAFKERVYRLRVQAFECWQYFIMTIDTCDVSDKLLNVLLIPLCASNHSVFEVLCAKLHTWAKLLDSNLVHKSTIPKKGVPNLLKILYGPHALRQASEFDDLVEVCGNLYFKMLDKCKSYETNDLIMGSLERAIPALTKNESSQNIANSIWTNALEHISNNNWPAPQFNYLIKTFQNLVSSHSTGSNALIASFLSVLLEIYGSFPMGFLKLNLALFCRCLFHVPESKILNLMDRLMKKCQNECLFFNEIVKTWHACVEEYKNELHKYWFAAKTCFLSWEKHEEATNSTWLLLLPVEHLHTKWDAVLLDEIRTTYDEVLPPNNADCFIKKFCDDLTEFISESENLPVSLLIAIVDLCKIVLQSHKRSDGVRYVKSILLAVFIKIPSQDVLHSATYKSFAPKFVATVLFFLKEFQECSTEFAAITQMCNSYINSNEKNSSELPVVQLIKKYNSNEDANNETVLKPHNGVNVTPGKTNNHLKTTFLSRLSSSIEKKRPSSEVGAKLPSTPKSVKSTNEDDVQFVAIKSKPKNSPMTEHQKEIAKSKSYIPALYEDLSQSQSQSQAESISLLSNKTLAPVISGIEYFEEDANLPPESNATHDGIENVCIPASPPKNSASSAVAETEAAPTSKKSLFKDKTSADDANKHPRAIVEPAEPPTGASRIENSASKRQSLRCTPTFDAVEAKRIRRASANVFEARNATAGGKEASEERVKKRGRPRKSDGNLPASQNTSSTEAESQNLFVTTPVRPEKSAGSPLDSWSAKQSQDSGGKMRRKSLKSKSSELSSRSPIATRKRKSSLLMKYFVQKKQCSPEQPRSGSPVVEQIIVDVDDEANNDADCAPEGREKVVDVEEASHEMNNSVVIIEPNHANEIISIDSENEVPVADASPPKAVVDLSEESTFFEDAEVSKKPGSVGQPKKVAREEETRAEIGEKNAESLPQKLAVEETPAENARDNGDQVAAKVATIESNAAETTDRSPTKISSPKSSPTKAPVERNEAVAAKETSPTMSKERAEDAKKKLIDETGEKGENHANAEQPRNTSPLSNNTRTFKIMKMACDSQNLSKPKQFAKISRSPLSTSPGPASSKITTNQRTMKILMANNGSMEKPRSSPTKIIPTSTERLKYHPKECTSPGILKKPDLNGSISSPKSAKFVNFAEKLTATRTFDVNEENYYDSYSSDDVSNSNLINDDEATSQEVLYSPLLNCSDDVKEIIDRLSLGKAAIDVFHRMGIKTVGHLASINTLTAKSIPAGDNRLHRLRKALKDYDDWRTSMYESKGLRIPSARRRILCKSPDSILEISSLIEMLDEAESDESSPAEAASPEAAQNEKSCSSGSANKNNGGVITCTINPNRMPTVVLAKLNEKNCPSLLNKDEIIVRLEEQSSPTKASKPTDSSRSPTKANVATDSSRSPTKANIATDSSRSPTKANVAVPVTSPRTSPTKTSPAKTSPSKTSAGSPLKEAAATKVIPVVLSIRLSPTKSPPTGSQVECQGLKSPPLATVKNTVAEAAAEEVPKDVPEVAVAEDASVESIVEKMIDEIEQEVSDKASSDQVISEDSDMVYTPQDEGKTQSKPTDSECIIPRAIVDEPAMPSPDIVTVDTEDGDESSEPENENGAEKESSVSIFSFEASSRAGNQQPEVQSQCASQSLIEASKNELEERSLFTSDEMAAPAATSVDTVDSGAAESNMAEGSQGKGVFGELLSMYLEPVVTDELRRMLVPDEQLAFEKYSRYMRKMMDKIRELRDSGMIGAEALRQCGLSELSK